MDIKKATSPVKSFQNRYFFLGIFIYLISFVGLCITPVLTFLGYLRLCRILFCFFLILPTLALVLFQRCKEKISKRFYIQMQGIYLFFAIFLVLSIFNLYKHDLNVHYKLILCEIYSVLIGCIFWFENFSIKKYFKTTLVYLKENKILCMWILFWSFLCLEALKSWINWDSGAYYQYIVNLKNFSLNPNDIVLFKNSGHASYAYMLFAAIGEFLFPNFGVGIRIMNILMLICIFLCFNNLLNKYFPFQKNINIFMTIILSVIPEILGPIFEIHVEISMLFFMVCFIVSYVYQYYIFELVFAVSLVFSKEIGIFLLFGFALGYILYNIPRLIKNIQLCCQRLFCTNIICFYIPALIFVIYFCIDGSGWNDFANKSSINIHDFNSFGINLVYLKAKIEQIFVVNFQWLILFSIICLIVTILLGKFWLHKIEIRRKVFPSEIIMPILGSFFMFLLSQLFYVTYVLPRYNICAYFFICFIFAYIFSFLVKLKFFKKIVCILIALLLLIENFITIDPMTYLCYEKIDIGKTSLASANVIMSYDNRTAVTDKNEVQKMALSPYTLYNRQYLYKYRLFEKLCSEINYTDKDLFLLPDLFPPISGGTYWGYQYDNFYNPTDGHIYQAWGNDFSIVENMEYINFMICSEDNSPENLADYHKIYYVEFPYEKTFNDTNILSGYNIISSREITYRGWSATLYELTEKEV